jgi:hypothetical protein
VTVRSTNQGAGVKLSEPGRDATGGLVENVTWGPDYVIEQPRYAALYINVFQEDAQPPCVLPPHPALKDWLTVQNLNFSGVRATVTTGQAAGCFRCTPSLPCDARFDGVVVLQDGGAPAPDFVCHNMHGGGASVPSACPPSAALLSGSQGRERAAAAPALVSSYPPPPPFLNHVFGSHMVLQRDAPALVYGFAAPGTGVTTNMSQASSGAAYVLQTQATADGVWRQLLPAQVASRIDGADAWAFKFASSAGESAAMADVLFGDVHFCSGQSNMQFTLRLGANASAECAAAALPAFNGIRVMSIYDNRSSTPREYIYPEYLLDWSVASTDSICPGGWGYMSVSFPPRF